MKELVALNIRDLSHLCKQLGTSPKELDSICKKPEKYYYQKERNVKGKIRPTATPYGRLREILDRLQSLLQRISLPDCIHGGKKGRSNFTNAKPHLNKPVLLKLDIKDFFPNVSNRKVYKVFSGRLGCSSNVASYLTILTTLNGSLPQGSPTSTILSAIVSTSFAKRIERLAGSHNSGYTQFVDDTAISGTPYIDRLLPTFKKIIEQEGFKINHSKTEVIEKFKEQVVTGIRVNQGMDAPRKIIKEVRKLLDGVETKINNGISPLALELTSIKGKIQYITRLNKGAGLFLKRRLNRFLKGYEKS